MLNITNRSGNANQSHEIPSGVGAIKKMKITGAAEDVEPGARHCTLLVGVECGVWGWGVACEMVRLWESMVALPHTQSP